MKENIVIIIPAYNPSRELINLIDNLIQNKYEKVIVINDGSKKTEIFNNLGEKVIILEHKKNLGKGVALKTGMKYCLEKFQDIEGIITVDADGQHLIEDINKLNNKFKHNKNCVILGSRNFSDKEVPLKSKIGNLIFRNLLEKKEKIKINDTQTGLRAIPAKYIESLINIKGERFEYETNMILYFIKNNVNILEEEIKTVYINKNRLSNYRSILDSIKIILQL